MLRQIKPRNARSKRALAKKDPKISEDPKIALFLRGTSASQVVQDALTDLHSLRQPLAKKFSKKNDIKPFENASSLEFFSDKNDASLLVFGSTSKKRPHTLTLARTFSNKILDMIELHLDPESYRRLSQFKSRKCAVGLRPMMVFSGTAFESPVPNEYTLAKSLFVDFFRGDASADKVDVSGLQYIVSIASDEPSADNIRPALHLRIYLIETKRSGQRLPRVELEEMGPRMDFRVGRIQLPQDDMWKEAMKKPKTGEEKTKKNITTDTMGDKIGRIHLGRQDLSELQTRKMKGLKRSRDLEEEVDRDTGILEEDDPSKRRKQ